MALGSGICRTWPAKGVLFIEGFALRLSAPDRVEAFAFGHPCISYAFRRLLSFSTFARSSVPCQIEAAPALDGI